MPAKILIIEDNEMNRDMLSRRLQLRGFEVVIATDGQQGIDAANEHVPDLIIMDLNLPVVDGWQAASRLKASAKTAKIPIVALTAHAMAGDREKAIAAGCDEYESKPLNMESLAGKMARFLGDTSN